MFDGSDNMLGEEDYLEMISYLRDNIRSKADGYVGTHQYSRCPGTPWFLGLMVALSEARPGCPS